MQTGRKKYLILGLFNLGVAVLNIYCVTLDGPILLKILNGVFGVLCFGSAVLMYNLYKKS